jgi:hypothetical protein
MKLFVAFTFFLGTSALQVNSCHECVHRVGKAPYRCTLYPNIIDDDFMDFGVRNPPRMSLTPCPIARRFDTLCGRNGKRFRLDETLYLNKTGILTPK